MSRQHPASDSRLLAAGAAPASSSVAPGLVQEAGAAAVCPVELRRRPLTLSEYAGSDAGSTACGGGREAAAEQNLPSAAPGHCCVRRRRAVERRQATHRMCCLLLRDVRASTAAWRLRARCCCATVATACGGVRSRAVPCCGCSAGSAVRLRGDGVCCVMQSGRLCSMESSTCCACLRCCAARGRCCDIARLEDAAPMGECAQQKWTWWSERARRRLRAWPRAAAEQLERADATTGACGHRAWPRTTAATTRVGRTPSFA